MARVNVYLPDDLADRARAAGVNISGVTQDALHTALAALDTDRWLDRLEQMPRANVPHERVIQALDDARAEFGAGSHER
jgi:post-segregation antitoxin (ccd killing protein)